MKRIITVSITAVSLVFALLMCMLLLASCQCSHTYSEWETVKAATCTEAGERTRTCSKCGEVETATVAALGHDLGAIIPSKEATCTEDGYAEHYHCARCGKDFAEGEVEITSAIPAVGHQTETVPETRGECSDGVLAHEHCSVCGKNFIDGVEKTDDELRIPGNHTLESVSEVPSNCTDEGTLAHEHCSVCGKNFIDGVEKTDDELKIPITHALESVSEVPSNCTDEGTLAHEHCTLCGKNFINGVEKTDDELKIPISHTLVIVPEVPATCTADGTIAHLHCTVCGSDFVRGEVKTAEELKIPASHSLISVPEVEATCTDDGTMAHERCTVCGKTFVGGVEKTASELVTTASHTLESVSAVPATCTDSGTLAHEHCTVCGSNFIDGVEKTDDELTVSSVGHAYGDLIVESGERNHYQCSECGKYFDENYLEITVLVIPTGHNFSEWTFEVPATCYATGTKGYFTCSDEGCAGKYFDIDYNEIDDLTIPVAHKLKPAYEYNSMYHYSVCTVCHGVIDEEEHALTTVYNQTDGQWYTYEECTVCGYKGDPIPFEKVESIVAENSFLIGTDNKDSFWVTVCTETGNYYTDCIRWYLCDPDAFDAMVAELETLGADSFPVKRTVSLCYYNFTAEIEITIDIPRTVAVPEYPVYQKGYLENLDNLMVKLLSNDGNEQFIYLYETIIIDNGGFDPNYDFADGDKVYTVSFAYDEEAYTFSFTFVDRAVVREIRCCADKVDCGTYPEIALNYSDGTTKYTDVLSVFDMVSGSYDKDTLGKQTFTLRSGDGFATAEVTVEVVDPRGIASVPDRVFIPLGTDPFEVSVTYNDGTEGVETVTQYAIIDPDLYGRGTPFDSSVVGEYHVIVRIGDRDAELRIYVYDPENKEVSEIYFTFTEPLVCENGGDGTPVIDLTGLYIVAVLNDGTEEIVPLTQDMLTYGEAGDDFFTVTYRGKEATVHFIESEKTVQEISVHGKDGNQAYALFIKNGVPQDEYWVKVTTSDYAYYYLALTADMIYRDGEAFDISTAASDGYDITVTYQGASCSLTLFIYTDADIEKSLYCGNDGTIVCGSEESVLSQIADMYFYYREMLQFTSFGTMLCNEEIDIDRIVIDGLSEYDLTKPGQISVTLSYNGASCTLDLVLIPDLSLYGSEEYLIEVGYGIYVAQVYENGYIVFGGNVYAFEIADAANNIYRVDDMLFIANEDEKTIVPFRASMLGVEPEVYFFRGSKLAIYTKNGVSYVDFYEQNGDDYEYDSTMPCVLGEGTVEITGIKLAVVPDTNELTVMVEGETVYTYTRGELPYRMLYLFNDNGKVYLFQVTDESGTKEFFNIADWERHGDVITLFVDGSPIGGFDVGEDGTLSVIVE